MEKEEKKSLSLEREKRVCMRAGEKERRRDDHCADKTAHDGAHENGKRGTPSHVLRLRRLFPNSDHWAYLVRGLPRFASCMPPRGPGGRADGF